MLPRIFEMFAQVDRALDRSQGGLGIGLTLVRSLVEMHGGTVEAHSDGPGQGSEFVVRLPALVDGDRARSRSPRKSRSEPPAAGPRRVLVVDDNVDAADSLADAAAARGPRGPAGPRRRRPALEAAEAFRPDVCSSTSACRRWTATRLRGVCARSRERGPGAGGDDRLGAGGGPPPVAGGGVRPPSGQAGGFRPAQGFIVITANESSRRRTRLYNERRRGKAN